MLEEEYTISETAKILGMNRKTVAKYCEMDMFIPKSAQAPKEKQSVERYDPIGK